MRAKIFNSLSFDLGRPVNSDVLRLKKPTNGFLCSMSTSEGHGVDFDESKCVLFECEKDVQMIGQIVVDYEAYDYDNCFRAIKYYSPFVSGFGEPHVQGNTWEAIHDVPQLPDETIEEMISCPYETVSDTFYFVGNELDQHNKARY